MPHLHHKSSHRKMTKLAHPKTEHQLVAESSGPRPPGKKKFMNQTWRIAHSVPRKPEIPSWIAIPSLGLIVKTNRHATSAIETSGIILLSDGIQTHMAIRHIRMVARTA